MKIYSEFHDGFLEGLRINKDQKVVRVYLGTPDGQKVTVCLGGVLTLKAGGFREGNIVLELSIRDSHEVTLADIAEVYELVANQEPKAWQQKILQQVTDQRLQLLEVNPSYGGSCLILAQTIELMANNNDAQI